MMSRSKLLGMGIALALSLSSCSLLPDGTPTVALCDIPPTPTLPARDGEIVVLEREHIADLLVFFMSIEECLAQLNR